MKAPDHPAVRARLGFLSSHYRTVVAIANGYQALGRSLDDIVIFLGDVDRPDVVDSARCLLEGIVDFDAKLKASTNVRKPTVCTPVPREGVKERLIREGVGEASMLDQPAPPGTIWVLALTEQGRNLTLVSLKADARGPEA